MYPRPVPLIILGGQDRNPATLPEDGRTQHVLTGRKAVETRIGGRPLVEVLVERLEASRAFAPLYLAGPAAVYRGVLGNFRLVDTDGSFGDNIRAGVERAMAENPGMEVGFTTCDILPEPGELRLAMDDFERHRPCDFWMPECRVPEDPVRLGQSGWKPRYRLCPDGESRPVEILPGHLILVDPRALRLDLIYRVFDLAYRTRNRPIHERRRVMLRELLLLLVFEDLRRLVTLRRPEVTWTVAVNALIVARKLQAGTVSQGEMAERLRRVYIRGSHRRRHPERRGRVAILDGILSLARDIDTEEEAREVVEANLRPGAAGQDPAAAPTGS